MFARKLGYSRIYNNKKCLYVLNQKVPLLPNDARAIITGKNVHTVTLNTIYYDYLIDPNIHRN